MLLGALEPERHVAHQQTPLLAALTSPNWESLPEKLSEAVAHEVSY